MLKRLDADGAWVRIAADPHGFLALGDLDLVAALRDQADGIAVERERPVQIGDGVNHGVRAHDAGRRRLCGCPCGREHQAGGQ